MEAELRKFMGAHGITGRMPSYTELREAGAYTLLSALSKHRGMGTFAKRLGYATLLLTLLFNLFDAPSESDCCKLKGRGSSLF